MILHEDDDKLIELANNNNTLRFTNKASGVTGVLEVDGQSVLYGCQNGRMELIAMMGNAVVNCYDDSESDGDYDN